VEKSSPHFWASIIKKTDKSKQLSNVRKFTLPTHHKKATSAPHKVSHYETPLDGEMATNIVLSPPKQF
jgi:hypothetical protein